MSEPVYRQISLRGMNRARAHQLARIRRTQHVAVCLYRLNRLVDADVTLLADELSLTERGIKPDELATGVQPVAIDELVERIVKEKTKAIWH
jgi:hypothetical protein